MEIVFENVSFVHNQKTPLEKKILDQINLTLFSNKITAIVGKSGSGKTTLIELINGLSVPTEGKIKVGEFNLDKNNKKNNINELRSKVGVVFEFPEKQFFSTTVEKEIEFSLNAFKHNKENTKKRIIDSLKMVGLGEQFLDKNPFILSNGEKRRVAIASILVYNPKVIILDEPTVGLDSNSKNNLIRLLLMLKNKYGKTIVVVSQDVDFLHKFVDYVYVINKQKIIMYGDKYEVFKEKNKLAEAGIEIPRIMNFSNNVLEKCNIKIGYRDEINDLVKDIYRYVK